MGLLIDLRREATRQGPGADEGTLGELDLTAVDRTAPLAEGGHGGQGAKMV
jgi:hypothetical protein